MNAGEEQASGSVFSSPVNQEVLQQLSDFSSPKITRMLTAVLEQNEVLENEEGLEGYDRISRTIMIPSGTSSAGFLAAVLFETNRAMSTWYYADLAELALQEIALEDQDPNAAEFYLAALAQLKDDYVSLISYRQQVLQLFENDDIPEEFEERYLEFEDEQGVVSYDLFVRDALESGMLEARAQLLFNRFELNRPYELKVPLEFGRVETASMLAIEDLLLNVSRPAFEEQAVFNPAELQGIDFSADFDDDVFAVPSIS